MKNIVLSLFLLVAFTGCSTIEQGSGSEYARLTVIYGGADSFGNRYFWETRSKKSDAMSFDAIHLYFGLTPPESNELKVSPFDFKIIDHLIQSEWSLVSVSSIGKHEGNTSGHSPVTTYHFSKLK